MSNNFLKYWAPLYLYAGVIFYFSSIPKLLPEVGIPFLDKALHFFEYAVFGVLAARALKRSSRKSLVANFKLLAILISVLYGISDEYHQGLVSERELSVFDMAADGVGAIAGVLFYGRYNPV